MYRGGVSFYKGLFYRGGVIGGVVACEMTKVFFFFVLMVLEFRTSVTKVL